MKRHDCPRMGRLLGGCRFEARHDVVREGFNTKPDGTALVSLHGPNRETRTYIGEACARCGKFIKREDRNG